MADDYSGTLSNPFIKQNIMTVINKLSTSSSGACIPSISSRPESVGQQCPGITQKNQKTISEKKTK
jgi:hypothetical protein